MNCQGGRPEGTAHLAVLVGQPSRCGRKKGASVGSMEISGVVCLHCAELVCLANKHSVQVCAWQQDAAAHTPLFCC